MDIKGKSIVITGALGEIGQVVATVLKEKGATVHMFDRVDTDMEHYYPVDLADEAGVANELKKIETIDVLINCAGEIYSQPIVNVLQRQRHEREIFDRVIKNNLIGCFTICSQVAEKMVNKRTKGLIINFSSISAQGNPGQVAYSTAKAGVESMTRVFARELGMFQIRACAIAPGFIDTNSTHDALSKDMLNYWKKKIPERRLGKMEDIISTICYMIECDYLSGCIIPVDGGLTI